MSVLDEVKEKRDFAQSRKDAGESGYDPAIDFYNRIIAEMEMLEMKLQNAIPLPELSESVRRYGRIVPDENRLETYEEICRRIVSVHPLCISTDPSAR